MSRFLKRFEDTDCEATQAGDVFRAEAGTDAATILVVVPVDDVMNAFDAPMPAVDAQYALRRGLLRRATRDPQSDLMGARAGFFVDRFAFDPKGLTDVGEVKVSVERRAAPNAPRHDTAMIGGRDLDEIRGTASLEQQGDIAFQIGLVAFGREMIVRLAPDHIGGDRALREQGIAGDVTAGDVAGFKQWNRHADFIGALLFITIGYGQGADFFWA